MADLALTQIQKRFDAVIALDNADLECNRGEVHALLGANGAGKSTLVKILSGAVRADSGRVMLDGLPLVIRSPRDAAAAGIGIVYQDLSLIPDLTVGANIFYGTEPLGFGGLVRQAEQRSRAVRVLDELGLHNLDPRIPIRGLSLAGRQMVEIAKVVHRNPQVVIFDEATSALSQDEAEWLLRLARRLAAEGRIVLFISHRLSEIRQVADRITVFRNGRNVATVRADEAAPEDLVSLMLGRMVGRLFPPHRTFAGGDVVLETVGLRAGRLQDVDIRLHRGEILGVGGLAGQGQAELFEALYGITPADGETRVNGRVVHIRGPQDALRPDVGIALVPEDRTVQGLISALSLLENVSLTILSRLARAGLIDRRREQTQVQTIVEQLRIVAQGLGTPVGRLSGGNQQKVVLGKLLLAEPKILLLYDSTRGVDVGTKAEVFQLLRDLSERGAAVLFYSTDVQELINVCDRVLVLHDGRIGAELTGRSLTEENVVRASVGEGVGAPVGVPIGSRGAEGGGGPVASRPPGSEATPDAGRAWRVRSSAVHFAPYAIWGVLLVLMAFFQRGLITVDWAGTKAHQAMSLVFAVAAQTIVVLTGGIDLSIGGVLSLTNALAATQLTDSNLGRGIAAIIAIGGAAGMLNGAVITYLRVQPFVATLASWSIWGGVALWVLPIDGGEAPPHLLAAATGRIWGVPKSILFIGVVLVAWAFLKNTRLGIRLYAVGSHERAAFLNGTDVGLTKLLAYTLAGSCAALAGLYRTIQVTSGSPVAGNPFILGSVAAVVIGGTSLAGGRGGVGGSIAGAFILLLIGDLIFFAGISSYYTSLFRGLLLIAAVAMYSAVGALARAHPVR